MSQYLNKLKKKISVPLKIKTITGITKVHFVSSSVLLQTLNKKILEKKVTWLTSVVELGCELIWSVMCVKRSVQSVLRAEDDPGCKV